MDDGFEVRLMEPGDISGVIGCIRATYLDTYPRGEVYRREWFERELKGSRFTFALVEAADGRVAAHMALREGPEGFYEMVQSCVDPAFRGHGLLRRMCEFLLERIPADGAAGIYASAITSHILSQKVNLQLGLTDVGIQLGSIPESLFYVGMEGGRSKGRDSWVIQLRYLGAVGEETVFIPERHREIAGDIYDRLKIRRRMVSEASAVRDAPSAEARISVKRVPDYAWAKLTIGGYSGDVVERMAEEVARLRGEGYQALYADVDVGREEALHLHEVLEGMGFFFCGLLPAFPRRDILRMQRLSFPVDPAGVHLASSSGERILCHAMKHMDEIKGRSGGV